MKPEVRAFYEPATGTISYIVKDPASNSCAVIDSVLEFDYSAGRISYEFADQLIKFISEEDLTLEWILETHVHADHLSAAPYIKEKLGGRVAIGEKITLVQEDFGKLFNEGTDFERNGSQFDQLFEDADEFSIGGLQAMALSTPGHTPACVTFVIGDSAFVGDTLFMPDIGSARTDFPGGDARMLFRSIRRVLSLPNQTRLFVCHDYPPIERQVRYETTVGEQRATNIHVHDGIAEDAFVAMRQARDSQLSVPKLILPSLQVNMRGGRLPSPNPDGRHFLKIPISGLKT